MKQLITVLCAALSLTGTAQVTTLTPGSPAPDFKLENVDGKTVSFNTMGPVKGYIVVFTCNTCPVARDYEQRIIALNAKYAPLGFPVIAINPNDPDVVPGDGYDKMVERAKANGYTFPYLFDKGQVATNAYGARNTPHIFLVKHTSTGNIIAYTGAIDNDPENTRADKTKYLENALSAVMSGKDPATPTTKAIGCTVHRKQS